LVFFLTYCGERYDEAKEQLNKALNSPIQDEDDKSRKEEAKQLLNQIKNK